MKKTLVVLVMILVAASAFAGGAKEPAGPAQIIWWDWQSGSPDDASYLGKVVATIANEYVKTHPNVTVERKDFSYGDYNAALKTALASGTGPDVMEVHPGAPSNDLAKAGQMLDLTSIIKGDKDWSSWIAPTLKYRDMFIDGKNYYIPMDVNHLPLVYWKEMFTARGIAVPTTIDEAIAASKVFKKDGILLIAAGFKDIWSMIDIFTVLVRTADTTGDLIDRANLGKASWEDPLFKKALQAIVSLRDNEVIPKNVLEIGPWPEGMDMFNKKKAAMFWTCGQFGLGSLSRDELAKDAVGTGPFMRLDANGQALLTGGASITMAVNPESKVKTTAVQFLKFVNGAFGQEAIFDSMRTPPGALVTKKSPIPIFTAQTNAQNTLTIGYRYIDNPDIYKAVADGIQSALIGGNIDTILKDIEKVSKTANK